MADVLHAPNMKPSKYSHLKNRLSSFAWFIHNQKHIPHGSQPVSKAQQLYIYSKTIKKMGACAFLKTLQQCLHYTIKHSFNPQGRICQIKRDLERPWQDPSADSNIVWWSNEDSGGAGCTAVWAPFMLTPQSFYIDLLSWVTVSDSSWF